MFCESIIDFTISNSCRRLRRVGQTVPLRGSEKMVPRVHRARSPPPLKPVCISCNLMVYVINTICISCNLMVYVKNTICIGLNLMVYGLCNKYYYIIYIIIYNNYINLNLISF